MIQSSASEHALISLAAPRGSGSGSISTDFKRLALSLTALIAALVAIFLIRELPDGFDLSTFGGIVLSGAICALCVVWALRRAPHSGELEVTADALVIRDDACFRGEQVIDRSLVEAIGVDRAGQIGPDIYRSSRRRTIDQGKDLNWSRLLSMHLQEWAEGRRSLTVLGGHLEPPGLVIIFRQAVAFDRARSILSRYRPSRRRSVSVLYARLADPLKAYDDLGRLEALDVRPMSPQDRPPPEDRSARDLGFLLLPSLALGLIAGVAFGPIAGLGTGVVVLATLITLSGSWSDWRPAQLPG